MRQHSPARARKRVRQLREEGREARFAYPWRYLCGTLYEMPIEPTVADLIRDAHNAAQYAQSVRKAHGRRSKRGTKQREHDIRIALQRLQEAMQPLRRKIARIPYLPPGIDVAGLHQASDAIQKERRKLWKMKGKGKPRKARKR